MGTARTVALPSPWFSELETRDKDKTDTDKDNKWCTGRSVAMAEKKRERKGDDVDRTSIKRDNKRGSSRHVNSGKHARGSVELQRGHQRGRRSGTATGSS